ncbi:MAG: ECF transporter S component [Eubacteriales bacterium]|nr:ECF transporter S component [Eubacteriales bacterium]
MKKKLFTTRQLTTIAILAAISAVLFMFDFPIVPGVPFYKLDFSNLPVMLGTFAMGPLAGTMILLIKSLLGMLHSTSQYVGELADFIMGLAMVLPAGFIYRHKHARKTALVGMVVGGVCATVAAVFTNLYLLIPFFSMAYHMPVETIVAMGTQVIPSMDSLAKFVLFITAPFNLVKWTVISVVTYLLYKPLSPLLHGNGLRKRQEARS